MLGVDSVSPCRYRELSVKAKSGLMLLGGVLIVVPVLLVANQADKPGMEPPVAVVSESAIPSGLPFGGCGFSKRGG